MNSASTWFATCLALLVLRSPALAQEADWVGRWGGTADGISYLTDMPRQAVLDSPTWDPSKPLPFRFDQLEGIAREDLRKLVKDETKWKLKSISLQRASGVGPDHWFFVVEFLVPSKRHAPSSPLGPQFLFFLVDFSGHLGTRRIDPNPGGFLNSRP